ncbi:MAG: LemA family protein [Alphaproteobacteria bacterium]|nr:LemA family protein [Alphaproteobacteria bacterium]MBF0372061.1 LemA family protein [Alphaproteobacteria bacterium]
MDFSGLLVPLVVGGVAILYGIGIYNRLVALKHNVGEAWSNIDVLLRQRYEELPKLVDVCKRYMTYERETLERIVALRNEGDSCRSKGDISGVSATESLLGGAMTGLLARVENYPDLKSNQHFTQLMGRVSGLQEAISDRREFYNEAVNINNIRREQFPDLIVARMFAFGALPLFEAREEERADMDMKTLFGS